jgi:hypothetical protein
MKLKSALLIIVFLCVTVWFVAGSSSFQTCVKETQNQASEHSAPERISQFIGIMDVESRCTGEFIHKNSEAIIAIFTIILGIATILLWVSTRDLVRGTEKVAQTQLRAFVFAKGFEQGASMHRDQTGQLFVKEWVFLSKFENVGLTPATGLRMWIKHQILPACENKEPHFEWKNPGSTIVIGPHGAGQSSYLMIPIERMVELWENRSEIYLAIRIEYRDIFNPSIVHHHEQCVMLDLLRHPSDVEATPSDQKNLPRVSMRAYGPQNTVA